MPILRRILKYKPVLKRLIVALIIGSPVVALTNNLAPKRVRSAEEVSAKAALKKTNLFFDHRCLGIKPPSK